MYTFAYQDILNVSCIKQGSIAVSKKLKQQCSSLTEILRFLLKNWRGSKECAVIARIEMAVEYLCKNFLKYSEFIDEQQDRFGVKMRNF